MPGLSHCSGWSGGPTLARFAQTEPNQTKPNQPSINQFVLTKKNFLLQLYEYWLKCFLSVLPYQCKQDLIPVTLLLHREAFLSASTLVFNNDGMGLLGPLGWVEVSKNQEVDWSSS